MPKRKVKRGVRVAVTCPNGHAATSDGRCTSNDCQYSANDPRSR